MEAISFVSAGKTIQGIVADAGPAVKQWALFLHGGGTATKEKYDLWQKHLFNRGISSLAFDFVGIGESQGKLEESSLLARKRNASDAIDYLVDRADSEIELILVGSSMGGHVAASLSNQNPVIKGLLLTSPGAYGPSASEVDFGPAFTAAITQDNDYSASEAMVELAQFDGELMVVYGSEDDLIPEEVKFLYAQECGKKQREYVILSQAPHALLVKDTQEGRRVYDDLIQAGDRFFDQVFS